MTAISAADNNSITQKANSDILNSTDENLDN